jgi:hypothetical protein
MSKQRKKSRLSPRHKLKAQQKRQVNAASSCENILNDIQNLRDLSDTVHDLGIALASIDEESARDVAAFPSQEGRTELAAAIFAIDEVARFLMFRAPSNAIDRLKGALLLLSQGHRPAMLQSVAAGGRVPDGPRIEQIKGMIAGVMHAKQAFGMPRKQAAIWIATHLSPKLGARISRKPITARVVEEWLDRFGGTSPPDDAGGLTFKAWSQPLKRALTSAQFRSMTERMSGWFPAR